jgi:deoxyadenosine/deoxycytidine kinase
MRIGLCGTISVGKTTLVNALKELEQFKDYETATERSKYLRDQGISLNTDSTLKGQLVFAAERSIELMKPNIITDRTLYDVCAFTLSAKSIEWYEKRYFTEILMSLRNEYDAIIYVSPEGVEIEDNGVRTTDAKYRDQIDFIIREMLVEYPPNKLIKIQGTTEQRISTILQNL